MHRGWALPVDASPIFPALVPQLRPLASCVTQHSLPKLPVIECLVMLGHTGPTCSLEGCLVSTDVKLDVGTVGLVVSRDIKLGLAPQHISSAMKSPGFAGQCRAMACGSTLALGKAEEDLQGWAVSVVVGQPCFEPWHGADRRTYTP